MLASQAYASPYWLTFKQAKEANGSEDARLVESRLSNDAITTVPPPPQNFANFASSIRRPRKTAARRG